MSNTEFLPTSLNEYVGQEDMKRRLRVYIEASQAMVKPLPHVLLTASPGQGKTALARVLANEVQDPLCIFDIAKMTPAQFTQAMTQFPGGVLFLDEVHLAKKPQQDQLLTVMEEGYMATPYGPVEIGWLTVIAATTEPEKLSTAFISRFPIRPEFAPYTDKEAAHIVQQMARRAELTIPEEVALGLGKAAAGTPRMARDLVIAYRALAHGGQRVSIEQVLDLVGVDQEGLSEKHLQYLKILRQMGFAGENIICARLRANPAVVRDLERVLLDRELIALTPKGRTLTAAGIARAAGKQAQQQYRRSA